MSKIKGCNKHTKYNGKNKPKYECVACLNYYLLLKSKPRALPKPTITFKDKTKYNRKDKHKSTDE